MNAHFDFYLNCARRRRREPLVKLPYVAPIYGSGKWQVADSEMGSSAKGSAASEI